MSKEALAKAIAHCGSQAALAGALGVKQQVVSYWLVKSRRGVPPEYAAAVERATNGAVTRNELRPDIFPAGAPAGNAEPLPADAPAPFTPEPAQ